MSLIGTLELWVQSLGLGVQSLGFKDLRFRVQGLQSIPNKDLNDNTYDTNSRHNGDNDITMKFRGIQGLSGLF